MNIFDDFLKAESARETLCMKYQSKLPSELIDAWRTHGFGSLLDGYLKMINPDDYQDMLNDTYSLSNSAIPIFVTAFADILTWEKGRYIRMIKYKDGTFEGIAAGFNFFWTDLADGAFDARFFDMTQYREAVRQYGPLQFNECFGYVPLLGLGGSKTVEHLRKVKIKEHIALIDQMCGII